MNPTICNIAFLISSAELADGPRHYQKTIAAYRAACGGSFAYPPNALIKLPERDKDALPPIIDYLLDNDVRPDVALEGFEGKVFPQLERTKDILKLTMTKDVYVSPFALLVCGGWTVKGQRDLTTFLDAATVCLHGNPSILSVAFEAAHAQGPAMGDLFIGCQSLTSRPVIVRTRDLMLAAKLSIDNAAALQALSSEQAVSHVMGAFSSHPAKHLAFMPELAHSL